jgi:hypothetical protein
MKICRINRKKKEPDKAFKINISLPFLFGLFFGNVPYNRKKNEKVQLLNQTTHPLELGSNLGNMPYNRKKNENDTVSEINISLPL